MNYELLYFRFCDYCKNVPPRERIKKRNPNDFRLSMKEGILYVESHHIVPRHAGGTNDKENLVDLLPEEHVLTHLIRYKAYGDKNDFISVRFLINGYKNPSSRKRNLIEQIEGIESKMLRKYAMFRQMVYNFRKSNSWHTEDGIRRISEARRGMIPCVDSETRVSVGSQPVDHPNVLSGKWKHHSNGMVCVVRNSDGTRLHVTKEEYRNNKSIYSTYLQDKSGEKNSNFKEMTEERKERIFSLIPKSIEDGRYFKSTKFQKFLKEEFSNDFKRISLAWINNKFGSIHSMLQEYNELHNTDYVHDSYHRSSKQRENIRNKTTGYVWLTNGIEEVKIPCSQETSFLEKHPYFVRGRNGSNR